MISEIVEKIKSANVAYRIGKPIMSDSQYDILIEELKELDPHNDILKQVGHIITDESRKRKLPIEMASMNKVKTMDEIQDWCRSKGISKNEVVIITPKYDGLSLCVDEITQESWTRGDGTFGQKSDNHYNFIQNKLDDFVLETEKYERYVPASLFTYGEVMMPKSIFISKYSSDFANPRNLVAGLLNSKDISESLKDTNYIKYGVVTPDDPFSSKAEMLDWLNKNQSVKVKYHLCKISDLSEDMLIDLFHEYSTEYEIDGLIIEIDDISLQSKLGRETSSNNPCWARAYKSPDFEQVAETIITGISWNISKQGFLKPTLHVSPVKLDGVTISNVTGNNARFVKDLGLGVGAKVLIKRSGMVIPIIYDVIEKVEFQMPNVPNIDWNDNGVELMTLTETDEQRFKQAVSFFEILEVDNVGEGVIKQLWLAGFDSIKSILEATPDKLSKLEGFGKRKAMIVYNAIQSKTKDVQLSKLQHATGFFKGLGSLKLKKLEQFKEKPTLEEVMNIEGFAQTSAKSYIESYDKFFEYVKDLPITIKQNSDNISNELNGKVFTFTGVRRPDLVKIIESKGGKEGSSVSKNTTYLVCVDKNSSSSKMTKAKDLGVTILDVNDLENLLK